MVRDLDKLGFEISQRVTTVSGRAETDGRVAYRFRNAIDVTGLGLRLADVRNHGLEGRAERCDFEGDFASDSTATDEEKEFLRSGRPSLRASQYADANRLQCPLHDVEADYKEAVVTRDTYLNRVRALREMYTEARADADRAPAVAVESNRAELLDAAKP